MNNNFTDFIEKTSDKLENLTGGVLYAIFAKGEYVCSNGRKNVEKRARLKRNHIKT